MLTTDNRQLRLVHVGTGSEVVGDLQLPAENCTLLVEGTIQMRTGATYKLFLRRAILRRTAGTWSAPANSLAETILPSSGAPTWAFSFSFVGDILRVSATAVAGVVTEVGASSTIIGS